MERGIQISNILEILKVVIPSAISVIGFIVTIYVNKNNLRLELRRQHLEKYMDNYKNIEYDVAEILQLSIRDYLGSDIYNQTEYIIQTHRTGEFKRTSNVRERLYRLGGYLSTYGSKETIRSLNMVRRLYNEHSKMNEAEKAENFIRFAVLLAKLLMQIKSDIFRNQNSFCIYDEIDWLKTRLPIVLLEKYQSELNNIRIGKKCEKEGNGCDEI